MDARPPNPARLEWHTVPAGPFSMGSDLAAAFPPDQDECPRRLVEIEAFRLARDPVTNAQYAAFAEATGRAAPLGDGDVPVTYVSWDDACAFCAWAGVRLPTEVEWEAAARGEDDRLWPWGDERPDASRALFGAGIGSPVPAGRYPAGASAHGLLDMAGNVWEWTASAYGGESGFRAVRGGAFIHGANEIRCSYRHPMHEEARDHYTGFRVAGANGEPLIPFDWIEVPGGGVPIGRDPVTFGGPAATDEAPQHAVDRESYALSLTPVTNAEYARFVRDTGAAAPGHWGGADPAPEIALHPVVLVDWFGARAFCEWAGGRLPTEAEWEKAARGADARLYPWGREDDPGRAVIGRDPKRGTTERVGGHPSGASPYGLLDMAGNVWEWVSSLHRAYPYDATDGREDLDAAGERVLRGGSYQSPGLDYARCAMRSRSQPIRRGPHIGFRVARDA
jgi:formylglycine-generating enzyme required for sulfatase activity